jgi:hypothetical protein
MGTYQIVAQFATNYPNLHELFVKIRVIGGKCDHLGCTKKNCVNKTKLTQFVGYQHKKNDYSYL